MAYDESNDVVVIFGGVGLDDTWEFDGTAWTQTTPAMGPSGRENQKMVYHPGRGVVLFGGTDSEWFRADTWEYDGATWTEQHLLAPSPRRQAASTYDSGRNRVIVFGGRGHSDERFGDTWELGISSTAASSPGLDVVSTSPGTSR